MPTPSWICRVIVFYEAADGRTRLLDVEHPHGAEDWTAEDWLNQLCAKPRVRSHWRRIEVTRECPFLRKSYTREQP